MFHAPGARLGGVAADKDMRRRRGGSIGTSPFPILTQTTRLFRRSNQAPASVPGGWGFPFAITMTWRLPRRQRYQTSNQFNNTPFPPGRLPGPPTPTPTPHREYLSGDFTLKVTSPFPPLSLHPLGPKTPRKAFIKLHITAPHDPRSPDSLLEFFHLSRDIPAYDSLRRNLSASSAGSGLPQGCILALFLFSPRGRP